MHEKPCIWNSGIITKLLSVVLRPMLSAMLRACPPMLAMRKGTRFGSPVVPLVCKRIIG